MDAGAQHENPEDGPKQQVRRERSHATQIQRDQEAQNHSGPGEIQKRQLAGVEQGDDDHRAEVVDDRQRRQKDFQGDRNARAEQGQDAQGKGDVGRGGDRPPSGRGRVGAVEGEIDQRRSRHSARRSNARQEPSRPCRELAFRHLAFDLKPDEEEEHSHERVVDPVLDAQRAEIGVNGGEIGPGEGRVGDEDRQQGDDHEQEAAGGFVVQEATEEGAALGGRSRVM